MFYQMFVSSISERSAALLAHLNGKCKSIYVLRGGSYNMLVSIKGGVRFIFII